MKILLVYPPFCTPASPSYSITHLRSFLKSNCDEDIEAIDLNIEFHKIRFPGYKGYYGDISNWDDYKDTTDDFNRLSLKTYSDSNRDVVNGKKPALFDDMLSMIRKRKPDVVALSIVYSSQAFYAYSLIKELKASGIRAVIGGPAANEILAGIADAALENETDLLEYVTKNKPAHDGLKLDYVIDFSIYNLEDYFTPVPVIPLKTSSSCFHKGCAFCSHFDKARYCEFPIESITSTIIKSKQRYFFLIDDMIPKKRLLEIAEAFTPLKIRWACQLRPTGDLDLETLKILSRSGLVMVMWGVESGNDRILKLMNKGTESSAIEKVLSDSHEAGIKNALFIIFGFPTERREEFLDTMDFLSRNKGNIDMLSVSVFGLKKGTPVYNNPGKFGIMGITEEKRTILEPKLSYKVSSGLSQEDAEKLKKGYKRTIDKMNRYPDTMNYFREHMLCLISGRNA
ncbi:hypothetical protein COV19_00455 [Candidatus Woesearchaeota archaeon CG10_big_fil_rev_8_21_14_0_10_44_13]|nr:MAG: hypothetical protein COV19_00455 [Candidatus Woesearchaeota archaeon CG10_big_fil_rev_8_21_14_0_10_44_13]